MVKRRDFMVLGSLLSIAPYVKAEAATSQKREFATVKKTIAAVQTHMFPEGSHLPSAAKMRTIDFTEETIFHPTYDKDIRTFVIEGAQTLTEREKGQFTLYNLKQKEEALRAFEKTSYGSNWLSRIMVLTMEAIFSDPVYGSNIQEQGWKSVQSFGGQPRPGTRYIEP